MECKCLNGRPVSYVRVRGFRFVQGRSLLHWYRAVESKSLYCRVLVSRRNYFLFSLVWPLWGPLTSSMVGIWTPSRDQYFQTRQSLNGTSLHRRLYGWNSGFECQDAEKSRRSYGGRSGARKVRRGDGVDRKERPCSSFGICPPHG